MNDHDSEGNGERRPQILSRRGLLKAGGVVGLGSLAATSVGVTGALAAPDYFAVFFYAWTHDFDFAADISTGDVATITTAFERYGIPVAWSGSPSRAQIVADIVAAGELNATNLALAKQAFGSQIVGSLN